MNELQYDDEVDLSPEVLGQLGVPQSHSVHFPHAPAHMQTQVFQGTNLSQIWKQIHGFVQAQQGQGVDCGRPDDPQFVAYG